MSFEKYFASLKRWFYLETILGVMTGAILLFFVLRQPEGMLLCLASAAMSSVLCVFVNKKIRAVVRETGWEDSPGKERFERIFDQYERRLVNWIMIAFLEVFGFLMTLVSFGINSKMSELLRVANDTLPSGRSRSDRPCTGPRRPGSISFSKRYSY
ncbi:hypothetical protein [Eubacterium pyruvativorans]|uniref:hypothetical protein n=1 Tax=Eubacterium pyruvativorans TaxID=155865 RepID=UPI0015697500|nr:hypothetical protein [Eubacterium pyruvativorans]